MPRVFIKTFGCQMNVHDTRRLLEELAAAGYEPTPVPREADLLLVNSCTVREKAWHKAISEVGRLRGEKKRRPSAVVGILGCVAQQEAERIFSLLPGVDLVLGPDCYEGIAELVESVQSDRVARARVEFGGGGSEDFAAVEASPVPRPVSAFVTVMKGCEERCSYCIVPSVRGPERFRPPGDVVEDVRRLVADGVREVVLLGQRVNAYRFGKVGFGDLLRRVDAVEGLWRCRFTSPHPGDMTSDVIEAQRELHTACEAIHLPVQAGSDRILGRMNRRYTRDRYLEIVDRLRRASPGIAFSTDLIVGFPGETDEDFADTIDLLERVRFAGAFSFKYSPRPGTPAAELPDDVEPREKTRRLHAAHEVIDRIAAQRREGLTGEVFEVLVEGAGRMCNQASGRARNNEIVNFSLPKDVNLEEARGSLWRVRVVRAHPHSLEGEPLDRLDSDIEHGGGR
ncbi:MAG: tRNA (N6-isopentenyl adenosine(37)-C2)-methylthiotransferase MiaB [Polyangia bacterium]